MPEPPVKPGGGPIGRAKRRMLERIEEMEEKQEAQWSTLKGKLQQERIDKVIFLVWCGCLSCSKLQMHGCVNA